MPVAGQTLRVTSAAARAGGARPGCLTASLGVGVVLVVLGAALLALGARASTAPGQAVLVAAAAVAWLFASQAFVARYLLRAHARDDARRAPEGSGAVPDEEAPGGPDDDGPAPTRGTGPAGGGR